MPLTLPYNLQNYGTPLNCIYLIYVICLIAMIIIWFDNLIHYTEQSQYGSAFIGNSIFLSFILLVGVIFGVYHHYRRNQTQDPYYFARYSAV